LSSIAPEFAANFTDRYAPYLNPLPEVGSFREFMRLVPPSDRSGRQMRYPLQAAISLGFTSDISGTAFAINPARPAGQLEAVLDGCDLLGRDTIPYSAMLKGRNGASKEGAAAAYWEPLDLVMKTLALGATHMNEIMTMYGCGSGATITCDIGVIFATVATAWNAVGTKIVTITRQTWTAGLWNNAGSGGNTNGGQLLDVMNAAGTALTATGVPVVGISDPSTCKIAVGQAATGAGNITIGERFIPFGWYQKSAVGVEGILQNVGTFAGISAVNNNIWQSRRINVGGPMTRKTVGFITAKLYNNGLDGNLTAFCNSATFAQLSEETSAPGSSGGQWFGNAEGDRTQGATKLRYVSPTGSVEIRCHQYMKQGEMFFLEQKNCVRVGASDITFRGADGTEGFFLELANNAGSEIRVISQQAPLIKVPYRSAIAFNITNEADDIAA
jgi:hypothetical protein